MTKLKAVVVGGGIAGLTTATALAKNGYSVELYEQNTLGSGATFNNFGQLHSGAIFAPVIPDLTKACWAAYSEYITLLEENDIVHGLACFPTAEVAHQYTSKWDELGIPYSLSSEHPFEDLSTTVYQIPDGLLHTEKTIPKLRDEALKYGASLHENTEVNFSFNDSRITVIAEGHAITDALVVLATGVATKNILNSLSIDNPLEVRHLPWAHYPKLLTDKIIYDLGSDLMGSVPDYVHNRTIFAQPGRYSEADIKSDKRTEIEDKLYKAVINHWANEITDPENISFSYQKVIEEAADLGEARPFNTLVDLSSASSKWGYCSNVIVALAGKVSSGLELPQLIEPLLQDKKGK